MDQPAPTASPPPAFMFGALVCACLLVALALREPTHLGVDTAMYAAIGDRLRAGDVVYRDLFELNPPLVMWLNVLPSTLAAAVGVSTFTLVGLGVHLSVGLSVLGALALLGTRGGAPTASADTTRVLRAGWTWAVLGSAVATWVLDWGQREHLLFLVWAPFLVLRWRREQGEPASPLVSLPLGLLTGLVACLKPHFVVAIVAVELLRALPRRDVRGLLTPEVLGVTLAGAGYAVALLSMPDDARHHLFDVLLPSVRDSYGHIASAWWRYPVGHLAAPVGVAAVAWGAWRHRNDGDPLGGLLVRVVLAAAAMLAMYVVQGKNWPYHRIPIHGFTWLALALIAARAVQHGRLTAPRTMRLTVLVAVLTAGWVVRGTALSGLYLFPEVQLAPAASRLGLHDEPVAMYSTAPLVFMSTASLNLGTDRTHVWDYPVCLSAGVDGSGRVALPADYVASLKADMSTTTARLVIIDTLDPCIYCEDGVSMPRVLAESGALALLQQRYTKAASVGRFDLWIPRPTPQEPP